MYISHILYSVIKMFLGWCILIVYVPVFHDHARQ